MYNKEKFVEDQLRMTEETGNAFFEKLYTIEKPFYTTIKKQYNLKNGISTRTQMIFVYPVTNYSGRSNAWIMIEIKEKDFGISVSSGDYSCGITILNKDGEIILSSGNPISLNERITDLFSSGRGIKTLYNDNALNYKELVYVLSNPDLIIFDKIEMPNLLSGLKNSSPLMLGVLIFLVLGCILAIYAAYYYYKPIHQLAQYMKKGNEDEHNESNSAQNEFEYIRGQYDSLNLIKKDLTKEVERQWPLVEERLITKLLYGGLKDLSEESIIDRIFYNQQENKKHFVLLIAEKNDSGEKIATKYNEHIKKLKEVLQKKYVVLCSLHIIKCFFNKFNTF